MIVAVHLYDLYKELEGFTISIYGLFRPPMLLEQEYKYADAGDWLPELGTWGIEFRDLGNCMEPKYVTWASAMV